MTSVFNLAAAARSSFHRVKFLVDRLTSISERRAARQTVWIGAMVSVQILSGIASVALSARTLGPEGYGVFALFMTITLLVHGLLYLPGDETITTYATRSLAQGRTEEACATLRFALCGALATAWLAYGTIVGLTLSIGPLFGVEHKYITAMLVCATVGVLRMGHLESLAILRLADRIPLAVAAMVVGHLVQVGVLVAAWHTGGGLLMVSVAYAASAGVYGVGMFIGAVVAARGKGLPLFVRPFSFRVPQDVVRFQIPLFAKSSLKAIYLNLDVILIAQLVSAPQLGLYRGARQIVDVCLRPIVPISLGAQAEYSRLWYASEGTALRRMSGRFTGFSLALAVSGYGLLALFCAPIVHLLLGTDFAAAAELLPIMIIGAVVFAGTVALHVIPAAAGMARPAMLAELAALMAQITALALLTPHHGAAGAAWAYTLYSMVFAAIIVPFAISTVRRASRSGG